ncbi:hypothetical protein V1477_001616 [Vespula maculifrons]|uniref:Cytochrome c oxidase assembly protein COX20, mitochondrial n=2 Tax=Vespula TaxID=7451 RepID=A0A834JEP9_VESVU|nr:hypothetical protein HZH66_011624 [Vespula vulgaris]
MRYVVSTLGGAPIALLDRNAPLVDKFPINSSLRLLERLLVSIDITITWFAHALHQWLDGFMVTLQSDVRGRRLTVSHISMIFLTTEIPCFRNSFLYGISSGIGGGLLAFLFTSRPKLAMHCAMTTYFNVTIAYWFYCRYTRDRDHFNAIRMQDIFQNVAVMEGTEEGPEIVIDKELIDV